MKRSVKGRSDDETTDSTATDSVVSDSVSAYFGNIKRYPLLTAQEEKRISRKAASGDPVARTRMIEGNLRLVVSIARHYVRRGLPLQDLIEEGNIGLIKSVERFKVGKGCKFSTYATYWIRQAVERAVANQANTVRLPIHISTDISRVNRAIRDLTALLQREPSLHELSDKTGLSGRYVKKLDMISRKSCSIDAARADGSDLSLLDQLPDESFPTPMDLIDEARRTDKVNGWLDMLDRNERRVIVLRFGFEDEEPETLERIGAQFGVTRERVRQIESRAIDKLRTFIRLKEGAGGLDSI